MQTFTYDHPKLGPITHNIEELKSFKIDGPHVLVEIEDDKGRILKFSTNAHYVLRSEDVAHTRPVLEPEDEDGNPVVIPELQ